MELKTTEIILKNRRVVVAKYEDGFIFNFRNLHKNTKSAKIVKIEKRKFGKDCYTSLTFQLSKDGAKALFYLLGEFLKEDLK